jgi:hypothetical protein
MYDIISCSSITPFDAVMIEFIAQLCVTITFDMICTYYVNMN